MALDLRSGMLRPATLHHAITKGTLSAPSSLVLRRAVAQASEVLTLGEAGAVGWAVGQACAPFPLGFLLSVDPASQHVPEGAPWAVLTPSPGGFRLPCRHNAQLASDGGGEQGLPRADRNCMMRMRTALLLISLALYCLRFDFACAAKAPANPLHCAMSERHARVVLEPCTYWFSTIGMFDCTDHRPWACKPVLHLMPSEVLTGYM